MHPLRNTPAMLALLAALAAVPSGHAFTPLIALTPEQLGVTASRHQLSASHKLECAALDTRLPQLTQVARRALRAQGAAVAQSDERAVAVQRLAQARARFTTLRC